MTTVSINRWRPVAPNWMGGGFRVEVCRLFKSERRAFGERIVALYDVDAITADVLEQTFAGVVRGPVERIDVGGRIVEAGDFRGLCELAADEDFDDACLFAALVQAFRDVNEVDRVTAGESAGRPGTSATTSPGSAADAAPAPTADA